MLFVELGAVILGLAVLARGASRAGLSPIPLYLLAGLAFGEGGLLPLVTAEEFIEVGAEIGVILLLLMLGLDFTARELTDAVRTMAPAGAADLALNFTPGLIAGLLLGWEVLPALLLGGVTYISSSGVIAKLLDDLTWTGNRETPVTLSILVIEDLAMTIYLPLMAVLLAGGGPGQAVTSMVVAIGAALMVLLLSLRFGDRLSRLALSPSNEGVLLTILGLALVVAGLAEEVGSSAAVGAFLVGIAISGAAADRARALLTPLRDLFAAVFFAFLGFQVDPAMIPPVLGPAIALAAVSATTKVATGWWSARRAGVGRMGGARAAVALIARGEFSLVIAGLAVAAGIEPEVGPLTATFVILLAVVGPVAAKAVDHLAARRAGSRSPGSADGTMGAA